MTDDRKSSLGKFLKAEREKRGLTIEQTSSATKIGLKILKQLENDQYSELPALPFVRGFVRNYGKFLGLDGEKLLQEYSSFLDEHSRERPKRDAGHSGYAFERPEGEQSRKILWGVMAGMLMFGGVVVFLFKPSLKRKHHAHVDKFKTSPSPEVSPSEAPSALPSPLVAIPAPSSLPSVTPSVVPTAVPFIAPKVPLVLNPVAAVTPSPVPAPMPSPSVAPVVTESVPLTPEDDLKKDPLQTGTDYAPKDIRIRVVLRTREDVWVRYKCDSKQLMKFALKKGKILVLRGKETVYFQTSNPDSITFKRGAGPEMLVSESPDHIVFHGNATLAWPAQPVGTIEEKFKVGTPLPLTPAPSSGPLSE